MRLLCCGCLAPLLPLALLLSCAFCAAVACRIRPELPASSCLWRTAASVAARCAPVPPLSGESLSCVCFPLLPRLFCSSRPPPRFLPCPDVCPFTAAQHSPPPLFGF